MGIFIRWKENTVIFKRKEIRGSKRRPFSGASILNLSFYSLLFLRYFIYISTPEKKDVFCYLLREKMKNNYRVTVKGSITVETSLVLPLFIISIVNIISLFEMIYIHTAMDIALNQVGKEISVAANFQNIYENDLLTEVYVKERVFQLVGENKIADSLIVGDSNGIVLLRSEIAKENDVIDLVMTYRVEPWFPFFQVGDMVMINRCYIKAYTGYALNENAFEERRFYVAENGDVYHLSRSCTHLQLSISMVGEAELVKARNKDGEKYKPCEVCFDKEMSGGHYYIAMQGNRYHSSVACTGLKRTIYVVKESGVGNKPLCIRCMEEYDWDAGNN